MATREYQAGVNEVIEKVRGKKVPISSLPKYELDRIQEYSKKIRSGEIDYSENSPFRYKRERFCELYSSGIYSIEKICKMINIASGTACNWLRSPTIKKKIEDMRIQHSELVRDKIHGLAFLAIDKMEELIKSGNEEIAYKASKDILDRGGFAAIKKVEVDNKVLTIEQRLSGLANQVIDITPNMSIYDESPYASNDTSDDTFDDTSDDTPDMNVVDYAVQSACNEYNSDLVDNELADDESLVRC
jgi:hypothetical protein